MIWEELLLPRWREATDLARAFGAALQLDPRQIVVVDDAAEAIGRVAPETPLLLQRNAVEGDVRQHVAAFPRRPELVERDEWTVLRTICRHLDETCFVPDEGLGETYFAVRPDGAVDRVLLDETGHGEFRIALPGALLQAAVPT